MNRRNLVRLALGAALILGPGVAFAQQALEIITLRHRTVEQVLPALQPLLEPRATLSGSRGQLFLRASAANAADIKRALEAIDRPLRRLQISVRFDDASDRQRTRIGADGTIGSGGSRIEVTAQDSRRSSDEHVEQRLRVLEGSRAVIFTGQSRPLRTPDGVFIQELATGFELTPRLSGRDVLLEIAPQRDAPGAQPGSVQGQRTATTIRTRLAEWVEIGGTASFSMRDERGIDSRRVWVKVEELAK